MPAGSVIAVSSVHFFACIFYKVKQISADTPEEVAAFYTTRGIDEDVSPFCSIPAHSFVGRAAHSPILIAVVDRIWPTNM